MPAFQPSACLRIQFYLPNRSHALSNSRKAWEEVSRTAAYQLLHLKFYLLSFASNGSLFSSLSGRSLQIFSEILEES